MILILKCYSTRTLVVLAPALLVFEMLLFLSMLMSGKGGSYFRAIGDVWRLRRDIWKARRALQTRRRSADRDILAALPLDLPMPAWRAGRAMVALLNRGLALYWQLALVFLGHQSLL